MSAKLKLHREMFVRRPALLIETSSFELDSPLEARESKREGYANWQG